MGRLNRGQAEIALIVPLLFCVVLLNSTIVEFLYGQIAALQDLSKEFEDLAFGYYYFADPVSGNQYPMVANHTPPK
ncbi:MAG: hypothetical protein N3D12_05605 [Candidatus Methanomethyliaceae archaeon]|nr:hypothetical protein [Candidatus Methanomethyliaceae archaeon]